LAGVVRASVSLRVLCALLVALASGLRLGMAQAQSASLDPPLLVEKNSLWRDEWPAFRTSEGIAAIAAGLASAAIVIAGPIEQPRWQGPILFDEAVRNSLRASDPEARRTYKAVGDWTYRLAPLLPLVDVFFVSAIGHKDSKLALNLAGILGEAYSYSGLLSVVSTQLSARKRPYADCNGGGECDTQSFYSGHSAIAATSAGLMCANHTRIALYGSPVLDIGSCVLLSVNAVVTATSRIAADRHYATDVIVGTGFGFAFGYAVPVLLHYSYGPKNERALVFAPDPSCGGNCISVRGAF